jgi:hypothetical protein
VIGPFDTRIFNQEDDSIYFDVDQEDWEFRAFKL